MRELSFREAITEALREEMRRDPNVFLIGEDIGAYGGSHGVTKGLWEEFGPIRIIETPISEMAIAGIANGAAQMGMRPIAEIYFGSLLLLTSDNLLNHAARMTFASGGEVQIPFVFRMCDGISPGGGPNQSSYVSSFMSIPGIKVVIASSPYNAKGLLKSSIRDNNPVLFFEPTGLYETKGPVPEEDYTVPLGKAEVLRQGKDVTLIAVGTLVERSLKAARILSREGVEVEVIDPQTLRPLDKEKIVESVKKTRRAVITHEGWLSSGIGAELAAVLASEIFLLAAPIKRLAYPDMPIPSSPTLAMAYLPTVDKLIAAVKEVLTYQF